MIHNSKVFGGMQRKVINKNTVILLTLAGILVIIMLASLSLGTVKINMIDYFSQKMGFSEPDKSFGSTNYIITQVRLPRIVLCLIVGFSLSLGGVIMQSLLKNPLASPHILGVSSGAAFGAAMAMVVGESLFSINLLFTGYTLVAFNAFIFGSLSLIIVMLIAKFNSNSTTVLILCGTAISSLFSAGVSMMKYFSNAEALKDLEVWLMGGFWGSNWNSIIILAPIFLIGFLWLLRLSWEFNALNAGEAVATSLGVNLRRLKFTSLTLVTLMTSAAIAFSGIIGFIGLIAPHICRNIMGTDNRYLIPGSMLFGGALLLTADTLARLVISPIELPVGILTALIGVPFFVSILIKGKKQMWM